MKRMIIFLFLAIFVISLASAEIIITEQPNELYNYGDTIEIPIKITTTENIEDSFQLNLICNGVEKLIHFENIHLSPGEEKSIRPIILLNKNFVERPGTCLGKATLGSDTSILTNEFEVSDSITITLEKYPSEIAPQKEIIIEGTAVKENGENVQGKVTLKVVNENSTLIEKTNTVKNGYFIINFSFPKDAKSGQYLIETKVQESDLQKVVTNKGFVNYNLRVTQVPTSLEIVFDEKPVNPGENLKVKTILHDQTGESIEATSIITIKDSDNKILEQVEKETNSFIEYPINYNEPPAEWKVVAVSSKLSSEETFNITQKENIEIVLSNRTLTIKNAGNVPYCNKSALVSIGNESVNVDVCLEVDEEKKYILTAPDGEYEVNVLSEGEEKIRGNVLLTGKAISVKGASRGGILKSSVMWLFIIAILGFTAYLFFKKGYKKSFFGYIIKKKGKNKESTINLQKNSALKSRNKAELSLSIKGEKQNISLVCLKVNDLKEIVGKKTGAEETLQKIINLSDGNKISVYENNDNLFFLFAPVKTRTFKNEKPSVKFAYGIKEIMEHHNRMMKKKMDFGISVNYGTIIGKLEGSVLKFMSMGTLMTTAKKIANFSNGEILLSEKIDERLKTEIKTEKKMHGNTKTYTIKEIKNKDEHKSFLANFVRRLEQDKERKKD